jgi:hypothetical protein
MKKIILLLVVFFSCVKFTFPQAGEVDTSCGTNGIVTEDFNGTAYYSSSAIQKDGKLVAVGDTWNGSTSNFAVARYNTDGTLDFTFSEDGKETTNFEFVKDGGTKSIALSVANTK